MIKAGLVVEGGGMRGVYSSGVLDFFIEKDLFFENNYGVSAGACHLCSYLAKQYKRAFRVNVDYLNDKRYCSVHSLLKTGNLFGAEMLYDIIPNELDLFDYDTYNKNESNFYVVITDINTGKPEYVKIGDLKKDIIYVRASSSLPLLAQNVKINDKEVDVEQIPNPLHGKKILNSLLMDLSWSVMLIYVLSYFFIAFGINHIKTERGIGCLVLGVLLIIGISIMYIMRAIKEKRKINRMISLIKEKKDEKKR